MSDHNTPQPPPPNPQPQPHPHPSAPNSLAEQQKWERASIVTDIALKILAVLVIPLFIWGVRLSNQLTAQQVKHDNLKQTLQYRIESCKRDVAQSKANLAQTVKIVGDNSKDLIRLQVHMNLANQSLKEIKTLLQGIKGGK